MLGNDLYRRAAPLLVDDLVRRAPDRRRARRPRGHASRARRRRAARAHLRRVHRHLREQRGPGAALLRGAAAARRDAGGVALAPRPHGRLGRQGAGAAGATTATCSPRSRRTCRSSAASPPPRPPPGWRRDGRQVARQPQRWSGRTAAGRRRHRARAGARRRPRLAAGLLARGPARPTRRRRALLPRVWSPGWNSGNGLHKLQEEVSGPLRGGPSGVRLLDGAGRRAARAGRRRSPPRLPRPATASSCSSRCTTSSAPTT